MSTSTQQVSSQILLGDGPPVDRFCDSFKYTHDKRNNLPVVVYDQDGKEYRVNITTLSHEDGSGHSVIFCGQVAANWPVNPGFPPRYVQGWFYAGSNRHGFMHVSDQYLPLDYNGNR